MRDPFLLDDTERAEIQAKTEQIQRYLGKINAKTEQERKIVAGHKRLLKWLEKQTEKPLRSK